MKLTIVQKMYAHNYNKQRQPFANINVIETKQTDNKGRQYAGKKHGMVLQNNVYNNINI